MGIYRINWQSKNCELMNPKHSRNLSVSGLLPILSQSVPKALCVLSFTELCSSSSSLSWPHMPSDSSTQEQYSAMHTFYPLVFSLFHFILLCATQHPCLGVQSTCGSDLWLWLPLSPPGGSVSILQKQNLGKYEKKTLEYYISILT